MVPINHSDDSMDVENVDNANVPENKGRHEIGKKVSKSCDSKKSVSVNSQWSHKLVNEIVSTNLRSTPASSRHRFAGTGRNRSLFSSESRRDRDENYRCSMGNRRQKLPSRASVRERSPNLRMTDEAINGERTPSKPLMETVSMDNVNDTEHRGRYEIGKKVSESCDTKKSSSEDHEAELLPETRDNSSAATTAGPSEPLTQPERKQSSNGRQRRRHYVNARTHFSSTYSHYRDEHDYVLQPKHHRGPRRNGQPKSITANAVSDHSDGEYFDEEANDLHSDHAERNSSDIRSTVVYRSKQSKPRFSDSMPHQRRNNGYRSYQSTRDGQTSVPEDRNTVPARAADLEQHPNNSDHAECNSSEIRSAVVYSSKQSKPRLTDAPHQRRKNGYQNGYHTYRNTRDRQTLAAEDSNTVPATAADLEQHPNKSDHAECNSSEIRSAVVYSSKQNKPRLSDAPRRRRDNGYHSYRNTRDRQTSAPEDRNTIPTRDANPEQHPNNSDHTESEIRSTVACSRKQSKPRLSDAPHQRRDNGYHSYRNTRDRQTSAPEDRNTIPTRDADPEQHPNNCTDTHTNMETKRATPNRQPRRYWNRQSVDKSSRNEDKSLLHTTTSALSDLFVKDSKDDDVRGQLNACDSTELEQCPNNSTDTRNNMRTKHRTQNHQPRRYGNRQTMDKARRRSVSDEERLQTATSALGDFSVKDCKGDDDVRGEDDTVEVLKGSSVSTEPKCVKQADTNQGHKQGEGSYARRNNHTRRGGTLSTREPASRDDQKCKRDQADGSSYRTRDGDTHFTKEPAYWGDQKCRQDQADGSLYRTRHGDARFRKESASHDDQECRQDRADGSSYGTRNGHTHFTKESASHEKWRQDRADGSSCHTRDGDSHFAKELASRDDRKGTQDRADGSSSLVKREQYQKNRGSRRGARRNHNRESQPSNNQRDRNSSTNSVDRPTDVPLTKPRQSESNSLHERHQSTAAIAQLPAS